MAQLVNVELRSVDDHVGEFTDGRHHGAFLAQAFANGNIFAKRVRAARLAVTAQERILAGIDVDQCNGMIFPQVLQEWRQFFELRALAGVDQQGRARKVAFASGMQLRKNRNQINGKIIDAVEAHVFEGFEYGAFAGAGEAGENNELARFASYW